MRTVITSAVAVLMMNIMTAIPAVAQTSRPDARPAAPKAAAKAYKTPRTPWGDPDLGGVYTNNDESGIPLERPSAFGTRGWRLGTGDWGRS